MTNGKRWTQRQIKGAVLGGIGFCLLVPAILTAAGESLVATRPAAGYTLWAAGIGISFGLLTMAYVVNKEA